MPAIGLILIFVSCFSSTQTIISDSDVAVALPSDWEYKCDVSVSDTPQQRPHWFAVSGSWLKEHL